MKRFKNNPQDVFTTKKFDNNSILMISELNSIRGGDSLPTEPIKDPTEPDPNPNNN